MKIDAHKIVVIGYRQIGTLKIVFNKQSRLVGQFTQSKLQTGECRHAEGGASRGAAHLQVVTVLWGALLRTPTRI